MNLRLRFALLGLLGLPAGMAAAQALAEPEPSAAHAFRLPTLPGRAGAEERSMPGRAVFYTWSAPTGSWVSPQTVGYRYNSQGLIAEEIHADSLTGVPRSRYLVTYTPQGQTTEFVQQTWAAGSWQPEFRYAASVDAYGNLLEESNQTWQNGAWAVSSATRHQYTYGSSGVVLTDEVQRWQNGQFQPDTRYVYSLNAAGQWSEYLLQSWTGTAYATVRRRCGLQWHSWPQRQLAYSLGQVLAGSTWLDEWRTSYVYGPGGTTTVTAENFSQGSWTFTDRNTPRFEADGSYTGYQNERWLGGAWVTTYQGRVLHTRDAAQNVVRSTFSESEPGAPGVLHNTERRNYYDFQPLVLSAGPGQAQEALQLYPNPTTGRLTLLLPGAASPLTGAVFNTLGQPVQHFALPATGQLDVSALPAGIYTVRLLTPRGPVARRLIRQ
jgi:hypothetical protein